MKSMNKKIAEGQALPRPAAVLHGAVCGYCKQAKRYLAEKASPTGNTTSTPPTACAPSSRRVKRGRPGHVRQRQAGAGFSGRRTTRCLRARVERRSLAPAVRNRATPTARERARSDRRAEVETERAQNEVMVPAALHLEIRRDRRELFCAHSADRLRPKAVIRLCG